MVDVNDRDRVLLVEREQGFIEGSASKNAGELVMIGENVGGLDERQGEDQARGADIYFSRRSEWRLQPEEDSRQRPEKADFQRLVIAQEAQHQHGRGCRE